MAESSKLNPYALPEPVLPALDEPYRIVITGVGGTGVVTIGALLGMAAHLENKGVTVLDMTGLAQKGGAVFSHVQIAESATRIHSTRVATGEAQLIIGCDAIVTASAESLSRTRQGMTRAVVNTAQIPTADFVLHRDWQFPGREAAKDIRENVGNACEFIDANALALQLLGDTLYANPLMLGYAWQKGWIPLSRAALLRAIELNGVAVGKNRQAFEWGRYTALHGEHIVRQNASAQRERAQVSTLPQNLDAMIRHRIELLTRYQNAAYATEYEHAVAKLRAVESALNHGDSLPLTEAVARNLAKLMAYKDEYEVARLYADPAFIDKLRNQFDGEPGRDYQLHFHLAPPLFARRDVNGHLIKQSYGPWMLTAFRLLSKFKALRGTAFDPFGRTAERRMERQLIGEYLALIDEFCSTVSRENLPTAVELACLPDQIRGFGHVKERAIAATAQRKVELLNRYRTASEQREVA